MIKSIRKTTLAALITVLALAAPSGLLAADAAMTNSPSAPSTPPASPKSRGIPFRGKLASVDKVAKTITLEGATKRTSQNHLANQNHKKWQTGHFGRQCGG